MSHLCPIKGCGTHIGDDKLMCADHWRLVPASMQAQVNKYWRAMTTRTTPELRLSARKLYLEARNSALTSVERMAPLC